MSTLFNTSNIYDQAEVGKILPGGRELTILVHKGTDDMSSSSHSRTA